jgi:hypothetical protein
MESFSKKVFGTNSDMDIVEEFAKTDISKNTLRILRFHLGGLKPE